MGCDLVVVGGGPVGLTLALALADSSLRIRVLEARASESTPVANRALALSHGSRLILERLKVWTKVESECPPSIITTVEVSQCGGFGMTRLAADELGLPALGYVVDARLLQRSLDNVARAAGVETIYGARVESVAATSAYAHLEYTIGERTASMLCRLAAMAEGAGTTNLSSKRVRHDYGQIAVVAEVRTSVPLTSTAYERFAPEGPIALLPFGHGYSLVWTLGKERATQIGALDDAAFLRELQRHFGNRLGEFIDVADRRSFPLALQFSLPLRQARMVAIGNAAQTLHPVAGQGVNLGIRDAFELAMILRDDAQSELASATQLERYAKRRLVDRWGGIGFTHGLLAAFASSHHAFAWPRGLALAALDVIPPFKRIFARRMLYGLH